MEIFSNSLPVDETTKGLEITDNEVELVQYADDTSGILNNISF